MKRPSTKLSTYTTPRIANLAQLLGSTFFGSISLANDEFRAIQDLYKFKPEPPTKKPEPPVEPVEPNRSDFATAYEYKNAVTLYKRELLAYDHWQDPRELLQAGADRNALRHAEADGLRIVAWLAKHVPAGEDPLKIVVQLASQAGWDVDPEDVVWAEAKE